jgi:predicted nucleic-acid-binding Zn-ribbon protein
MRHGVACPFGMSRRFEIPACTALHERRVNRASSTRDGRALRRRNVAIPAIEQAKIQAKVLVPLIKLLQTELGEERTHAIVRKAIGDAYRQLGAEWWRQRKSTDVGSNMESAFASFAKGGALDFTVNTQSKDIYQIDVTRCQYAEFYKELSEPELGFLLVCSLDFPFVDGFGSEVKLTRTQTIMQGASYCDFLYERQDW